MVVQYNYDVLPAVQTAFLYDVHHVRDKCRFHGDQCDHHTNIHSTNKLKFSRHIFKPFMAAVYGTIFKRIVLPAVKVKFTSNLYVTKPV
jgi:hypothetical protein